MAQGWTGVSPSCTPTQHASADLLAQDALKLHTGNQPGGVGLAAAGLATAWRLDKSRMHIMHKHLLLGKHHAPVLPINTWIKPGQKLHAKHDITRHALNNIQLDAWELYVRPLSMHKLQLYTRQAALGISIRAISKHHFNAFCELNWCEPTPGHTSTAYKGHAGTTVQHALHMLISPNDFAMEVQRVPPIVGRGVGSLAVALGLGVTPCKKAPHPGIAACDHTQHCPATPPQCKQHS
jgi:hypothetical protein